nr:ATP-binding cassette domain-containing protein [Kocuria palustris]
MLIVGLSAPRQIERARPRGDDGAADASPAADPAPGRDEPPRSGPALGEAAPRTPGGRAPAGPALQARLEVRARSVRLGLDVGGGETIALMGPNGAGKSTALEVLAGLLIPDAGRVRLGERVLLDTRGRGAWVPPHERRVTLLAQRPLLFPQLSVLDNAAFAPRCAGLPRTEARARAREWLREVGAEHLAERRAGELSGGQAQRVALARALAAEPDVLLLDEPLAAVDRDAAEQLRRLLRRVLEGRTAVLVTHDVRDARALAHRTVRLEAGRAVGSEADAPARPARP